MDNAQMTTEAINIETTDTTDTGGILAPVDTCVRRHIGPSGDDVREMLALLGEDSLNELVEQTVPAAIRLKKLLKIGEPRGEYELLRELRLIASKNKALRSFIGMGYYDT